MAMIGHCILPKDSQLNRKTARLAALSTQSIGLLMLCFINVERRQVLV